MDLYGYTWESFEVTTEDSYILTTFHITGKVDKPYTPTKESILVQHGFLQDAASWIHSYATEPPLVDPSYEPGLPMALQLADLGYDIWLGNNRGTEYSQGHETLTALQHEYWNWTWSEMGLYDDPANITFIKEKAKQDKIFYIGYSQGTVQMFYGLSHIEESFLQDNLIKFIAMAPCSISTGKMKDSDPTEVDHAFYNFVEFQYHKLGIYDVKGPDWESSLKRGCKVFGKEWCNLTSTLDVQPYGVQ